MFEYIHEVCYSREVITKYVFDCQTQLISFEYINRELKQTNKQKREKRSFDKANQKSSSQLPLVKISKRYAIFLTIKKEAIKKQ